MKLMALTLGGFVSFYKIIGIFLFQEGNVIFNDALNTFLFTVIWR